MAPFSNRSPVRNGLGHCVGQIGQIS